MRAVNLIPSEERRGAGGAAGRSGGMAYGLLGALGVGLVLLTVYAIAGRTVNHRRAEVARVTAQADAAQATADRMAAYTRFAELRQARVQTVSTLATSRFDWAHAMHELARVIPPKVALASLKGSLGGAAAGVAASADVPAVAPKIELQGCAGGGGQKAIARLLTRLRLVDGVADVTLSASDKADDTTCSPKFTMTVTYAAPSTGAAAAAPGAAAATPAGAAATPGGAR